MSCEDLQNQINELLNTVIQQQKQIDTLEKKLVLLTQDLETIRFEGCWKFHEDPNHEHKK